LVFAIGLCLRLVVVAWAWQRIPPAADGRYYHQLAMRIAQGHGYTWLWPDGAISHVAHYPVGYPAALAAPYALLGASPGWGMLVNALLGALACLAVQQLLRSRGRSVSLLGGLLVAVHPGLCLYTPALMTEGVIASLLVCAVWAAATARAAVGARWRRIASFVGCGLLLCAATLVRPQSLLMAPVLGALAVRRQHLRFALFMSALTLLGCAPWTLRNCQRMGRCAFVSVNRGWNLLIGTDPAGGGGWAPLKVPPGCTEVFDEAQKDTCFERHAMARITARPGDWLALIPNKLAVTFDYGGAPGWYLHEAAPAHFGHEAKLALGVIETLFERLALVWALIGSWWLGRSQRAGPRIGALRGLLCACAIISALSTHATLAFLGLVMLAPWSLRALWPSHAIQAGASALVLQLALVHAVFFGSGRYQLVVWPLLCALAAVGWSRRREAWRTLVDGGRSLRGAWAGGRERAD